MEDIAILVGELCKDAQKYLKEMGTIKRKDIFAGS